MKYTANKLCIRGARTRQGVRRSKSPLKQVWLPPLNDHPIASGARIPPLRGRRWCRSIAERSERHDNHRPSLRCQAVSIITPIRLSFVDRNQTEMASFAGARWREVTNRGHLVCSRILRLTGLRLYYHRQRDNRLNRRNLWLPERQLRCEIFEAAFRDHTQPC